VLRTSWGPWYLHASLLEAPPDDLGTRVGESLRFLGADIDRLPDVHAGDVLPVRLWWATDLPTATDFSVTFELHASDGTVVARLVDPPQAPGAQPLPGMLGPGEIILDPRQFRVPFHLDDGMYTLRLVPPQQSEDSASAPEPSSPGRPTLEIDRFHLASFAIW
jgi:hypothetical protein